MQAPHWPWSQPFLVPIRSSPSRSRSSNVVQGSIARVRVSPLIVSVVDTVPIGTAAYVAELMAVGMISAFLLRVRPGWR